MSASKLRLNHLRDTYVFFASEFSIAVCKMTGIALRTVSSLHVVLADLCLVEEGNRLRLRSLFAACRRVLGQILFGVGCHGTGGL